jgi:hypothetical protein
MIFSNNDIEAGLRCSYMGRPVATMTSLELVGFIGMLDALATQRARKIADLEANSEQDEVSGD